MHGGYRFSQSKDTQVSCAAKINARSQILESHLLLRGALLEKETLNRQKKEIMPKIVVTTRAASPIPQNEGPPWDSFLGTLPARSMASVTRLVS